MNSLEKPLVSVVIPCYNHENFVQGCIQSVIDQTYQNIELIIIDDGSKDNSVLKIKEMREQCVKRFSRFEFRQRENKGLSVTLNESLEWCKGTFYSAIASDDMMLKDKIKIQVNYLMEDNTKDIVGVFGGYNLIDNNNLILKTCVKKAKIYCFNDIFFHNFDLPAPSALLLLDAVKKVGGYAESLKIEDWYMWLKLTESGNKLIYLNNVLVNYRSHEKNTSKNFIVMNEERIKVINHFFHKQNYESAHLKVQWLKATDYLYVNKFSAFKQFFNIIQNNTEQLISLNIVRFFYHMLKSYIK
ncbi:glycosyltransferase family 2 protein [Acinetobacter junii]|uniref:glycosyltransferase family 2 protein n=1 Tax=Acinetobacter junii TaxID=40215 RepID=UPI0010AA0F26|nr:glycosyltransferase [Acinetobacter junii]TID67775.1 glycosyl transferase family 2 [Acinetobacter junii]